jgi:transposase
VKGGRRLRSKMFAELQSYLFDDRFGRPGKGNDKGKVEVWSAMSGAIS